MMKNKSLTFLFIISVFSILYFPIANAEENLGKITAEANLRIRKGPGQSYEKLGVATYNSTVTILSYDKEGDGCDSKWAKIKFGNIEGYACSTYIEVINTENNNNKTDTNNSDEQKEDNINTSNMNNEDYEKYLDSQGFPESYKVKLRELHKLHPNWIFIGTKTNYSWASAVIEQDEFVTYSKDESPGRSFLNVNTTRKEQGQEGYLSTEPADYNYYTNTFIKHDGTYWFQANTKAIEHFMDPRNYLTEKAIFMFEDLSYDSTYQTEEAVKLVLSSTFLKQFSPYFMKAAKDTNTSPIYLASLVRQEVGTSTTNICTNGKAGVLSDGINYTGYYNFFNIGASSSTDPKLKSLQRAKANQWNSEEKAIVEGANIISKNYIQCGQHTLYYQKYNFSPKATKGMWHQYTTNINSLESQSNTTYNSYKSMGLTETTFKFDIPIFTEMPESTPLPPLGNPNNYMKEIKVNNISLTNFDGANTKYEITIPYTESVTISGTLVASTSKVEGLTSFEMKEDTIVKNVVVTSQNGLKKTYEITIKRLAKPTPTPINNSVKNDEKEDNKENLDNVEKTNNVISEVSIDEVIKKSTYVVSDTYLTNITFGTGVSTIIDNLKKYGQTISITIKDKDNNSKTSGTIYTGDKVIIGNGKSEKTYTIVIYGDTNGDGEISAIDLLNVQKIILNKSNLSGASLKAADTNKDGKVSAIDLLNVQKHILGKLIISQN